MLIIGIDPGISGSICFFQDGVIKDVVTEFFDILEDDDDVQNIFSNVNLEVN